jgi:hypothetical protein
MVDWKSLEELMREGVIFSKFMHALLGLYAYVTHTARTLPYHDALDSWEFFISLPFEWDFITGRKRFRWPLVSPLEPFSRVVLMGILRCSISPGGTASWWP